MDKTLLSELHHKLIKLNEQIAKLDCQYDEYEYCEDLKRQRANCLIKFQKVNYHE